MISVRPLNRLGAFGVIIIQLTSLFAETKSDFVIETLHLENARVEDALYFLQRKLDTFRTSNPTYPVRNIEFSNNLVTLKSPQAISNYDLISSNSFSDIQFEDALSVICEASGVKWRKAGATIYITDKKDPGQLQIRAFYVAKDIFIKGKTPKESLKQMGLQFPEGSCAIYSIGRGVLVCLNYESALNDTSSFLNISKKGRQMTPPLSTFKSNQVVLGDFTVGSDIENHDFFFAEDSDASTKDLENIFRNLDIPIESCNYTRSNSKLLVRAPYHIIQFLDSYIRLINGRPNKSPSMPLEYLQAVTKPKKLETEEIKDEAGNVVKEFTIGFNNKTYANPLKTRQTSSTLSFVHDDGVASIPLNRIDESIQHMLGYNSQESRPDIIEKVSSPNQRDAELITRQEPPATQSIAEPEKTSISAPGAEMSNSESRNLIYNGFPIEDIIRNGVVAIDKAPIYELQQGEGDLFDLVKELKGGALDSLNPMEQNSKRQKLLQSSAVRNPRPGALLGYVRSGFVLRHLNWRGEEFFAVCFPKDIGGQSIGCVKVSDFAPIGGANWWVGPSSNMLAMFSSPNIGSYVEPTKNTVLLSPFLPNKREYHQKILSNSGNIIHNLRLIQNGSDKLRLADSNILATQALAETPAGFFLGYYIENEIVAEAASVTWEQVLNNSRSRYKIRRDKSSVELKDGDLIVTAFDKDRRNFYGLSFDNPNDLIIGPSQYERILLKGQHALLGNLEIPKSDGFELAQQAGEESSSQNSTSPQLETQKNLNSIEIRFKDLSLSSLSVTIVKNYKTREVERLSGNFQSNLSYKTTPWKDVRENYSHEYGLGIDGTITITDGVKIYRISQGFMKKPEMTIYSIEEK